MVTLLLTLHAGPWKLVKEKAGIRVLTQKVEGSDYLAFEATIVIDASIAELLAVMYDTEACPEWLYECSKGFTLEARSFEENYVYELYDLTFPVSDRGVILRSTLVWDKGVARLTTEEVQDFCEGRQDSRCQQVKAIGAFPLARSRGEYRFERLSAKRSKVRWRQHTEPGGSVPTWLVNVMIIDLPFESLKALREIVKKPRYQGMTKNTLRTAWQKEYDHSHNTEGVR